DSKTGSLPDRTKAEYQALLSRLREARLLLVLPEGPESLYQIDLWYEYCLAVDTQLVVVARSIALYSRIIKDRPSVLAVRVDKAGDAEQLLSQAPQLKAILYVANTGSNNHFLRTRHLTHIFLGHGDSEKAASCRKQF